MALTPYEKQKRWREKHRALYNLQQRNRRKGKSGAKVETNGLRDEMTTGKIRGDAELKVCTGVPERENDRPIVPAAVGEIPTPATFTTKKVGEFRMIVLPEEKPYTEPPVSEETSPPIRRDEWGNRCSEKQYQAWQEKKKKAKEKGFVIDEYSQ